MNACREIILKNGDGGTGFIFNYKNKNFLVTAAHVVVGNRRLKKKQISISMKDDEYLYFEADLYYHHDKNIDICVIPLKSNQYIDSTLSYHDEPVEVGAAYYIFGYPSTIENTYVESNNTHQIPIPVIRKGIASHIGTSNDIHYTWLDMIAIEGFSGSPVVAFHETNKPYVLGVLTNGNQNANPVVDEDGKELEYYSLSPTGFARAVHIIYVIDIIEQNGLV
jgi:hypothetical protein